MDENANDATQTNEEHQVDDLIAGNDAQILNNEGVPVVELVEEVAEVEPEAEPVILDVSSLVYTDTRGKFCLDISEEQISEIPSSTFELDFLNYFAVTNKPLYEIPT